jgi:hypothetical protein
LTGLGIRQKNSVGQINLSFKDIIKNIGAIDNIGWGFSTENDIQCVRVEKWDWFYNSNVILSINNQ